MFSRWTRHCACRRVSSWHDSSCASFLFIFALGFTFNLFARESTLLDSGWRFRGRNHRLRQAMSQRMRIGLIPIGRRFPPAQLGLGTGAGRKKLLSRAGLVSARTGHRAGIRQRYFLRFEAASLVADVYLNGNRWANIAAASARFALKSRATCRQRHEPARRAREQQMEPDSRR